MKFWEPLCNVAGPSYHTSVAEWFGATTTGEELMKNIVAIVIALASANVLADAPTLAQPAPTSVLVKDTQPTAAPAAETKQEATPVACCETAQEVKLGPWQARRLARQADRQEARDCCGCKCDCCKKDSRPSALVLTKKAAKCACGCQ